MPNLHLSDNSKVKFKKNHYNTFGLTHGLPKNGGTCTGATTGNGGCCNVEDGKKRQTCYVAKIIQIYKAVGTRLMDNTNLLKDKTQPEMEEILESTVLEFLKKNKSTDKQPQHFRLHWSGDFWSEEYTKAWANVMGKFPYIRFWVYTRSHDCVQHLVNVQNVAIYISIDPINIDSGYKIYEQFKQHNNVGLAFMGNNAPTDKKYVVCPEVSGKIKNTSDQGACSKCKLCFTYKDDLKLRNIQFPIH